MYTRVLCYNRRTTSQPVGHCGLLFATCSPRMLHTHKRGTVHHQRPREPADPGTPQTPRPREHADPRCAHTPHPRDSCYTGVASPTSMTSELRVAECTHSPEQHVAQRLVYRGHIASHEYPLRIVIFAMVVNYHNCNINLCLGSCGAMKATILIHDCTTITLRESNPQPKYDSASHVIDQRAANGHAHNERSTATRPLRLPNPHDKRLSNCLS